MYKEAKQAIKEAKTIYISGHERPDGDAIGSAISMYLCCKNLGKDVKVVMPEYGRRYNFLKELKETVTSVQEDEYDLLICVDTSSDEHLAISPEDKKKAKKVVVFDHHKNTSTDGNIKVLNDEAPANCEIMFDFYKKSKFKVDNKMAGYLYLGLLTDTGSFNYKRTTSNTYRIAADLIDLGADFVEICKKMNDTCTEARLKVIAHIANNMETYFNGKVRMCIMTKAELENLCADENDIEGIVNYLRMVEGTEVAIFIREIENGISKVSIRTEGRIDGAKIAAEFGGGGHIRASGFNTNDVEKTKQELLKVIGVEINGEINGDT